MKIDPPIEDLQKEIDIHEVIAAIFSKEPVDLSDKVDESPVDEVLRSR